MNSKSTTNDEPLFRAPHYASSRAEGEDRTLAAATAELPTESVQEPTRTGEEIHRLLFSAR